MQLQGTDQNTLLKTVAKIVCVALGIMLNCSILYDGNAQLHDHISWIIKQILF